MTHHTINGLITGLAVIFASVIVAAVFYGPDSSTELEFPGRETTEELAETDDEELPDGVGGVAVDSTATPTPTWSAAGTVVDTETSEPIVGAQVEAHDGEVVASETTTDEDGAFELSRIPATSTLIIDADGYHTFEQELDESGEYTIQLQSSVVSGRVVGPQGSPVQAATVASGEAFTRTVQNGEFRLEDAPAGEDLIVKAAGYETTTIAREQFTGGITLAPMSVRGIYASAHTAADSERLGELVQMIERTELNALVIDVKNSTGQILFDSQNELARDIGAVQPVYDAEALIDELHERGIYAIARVVVFEDSILAEERPGLAVVDSESGDIWRTWQDLAWVNPYETETWQYNVALLTELAELGFDEIQLDYARFPTDGPLNRADYGTDSTAETREQAIRGFLEYAYEATGPTRTALTANVFALSLWFDDEGDIGQRVSSMVEHLDHIHPMIYPSHFAEGSIGLEMPSDHPYDVVYRTLESGYYNMPGHLHARVRPWLQDFSYGPGMRYGEEEVREQIEAANNAGASGWMLWNADNYYHEAALEGTE